MTKPTHVLFVGATGSIGRLAVAEGLAQGYQVRALVRDTSRAHFDARVDMFEGDLTSVESLNIGRHQWHRIHHGCARRSFDDRKDRLRRGAQHPVRLGWA
ncbi:MAG: NAD(P)H-binding protein [Bifidobacterium dentium]